MLVTSIFSFSYNVFKKLLPQGSKNQGLFGKQLRKHCSIVKVTSLFASPYRDSDIL